MYNFGTINHKTLLIKGSLYYHVVLNIYKLLLYGPQNFLRYFVVRQIFFQWFLVRKLKKCFSQLMFKTVNVLDS